MRHRVQLSLALLALGACTAPTPQRPAEPALQQPLGRAERSEPTWTVLFGGAGSAGWEVSNFGGEDEVMVRDGRLILPVGVPLSGVHWTAELPTIPYEIEVVARRLSGTDFFCGLTLPLADGHATVVLGGWGGAVVGLSNVDGQDASSNETTSLRSFEDGVFETLRVRVTNRHVRAWLGAELLFDQPVVGHRFSLRPEVLPSRPLGIAAFATRAEVANVRWRALDEASGD